MTDVGQLFLELSWLWASVPGLLIALLTGLWAMNGDDWAPLLVMATVPVQRELMIGFGDTHLTYTQIAVAAFLAGALVRFAGGRLRIRIDGVTAACGAIVGVYGLSVLSGSSRGDWAGETYRWLVSAVFLVVARSFFTGQSVQRVTYLLLMGSMAAAVWALGQVILESGPPSFVRSGLMRAHGAFGEPNPFAAFAWALLLPLLACCAAASESRRQRLIAGLGATIGVGSLLLTQSRGGYLGAGAGVAVIAGYLLLRNSHRHLRYVFALGAVLAALVVIGVAISTPWDETGEQTTSANWADQERTAHWSAAVEMVKEQPFLGVGAGGYSDAYRPDTTFWRFRISRGHAHNAYLQVAAEAGIPAMLAYIWLLAGIVASLVRRVAVDRTRWLSIGTLGMTAALATHQLVDYLHVLSLGILFAGLWAAALAVGQKGPLPREHKLVA